MRGRKPKPRVGEITPCRGVPECPAHLTGAARQEWGRICEELDQMGILCTADRTIVAVYCAAWAKWAEAERNITEMGMLIEMGGGIDKHGNEKPTVLGHNPWCSVAKREQAIMLKAMIELGLTPAARLRVKANVATEEDEEDLIDL